MKNQNKYTPPACVRLDRIDTAEEFIYLSDIWYSRMQRLEKVWRLQTEPQPQGNRVRAHRLYVEMLHRIHQLRGELTKQITFETDGKGKAKAKA